MNKEVKIFLIKLFGTFAVLILIIMLGKELKSSETLEKRVHYDPMYEESLAKADRLRREIELQIQLENEKRAREFDRSTRFHGQRTY